VLLLSVVSSPTGKNLPSLLLAAAKVVSCPDAFAQSSTLHVWSSAALKGSGNAVTTFLVTPNYATKELPDLNFHAQTVRDVGAQCSTD
jgi:hypothetical protein